MKFFRPRTVLALGGLVVALANIQPEKPTPMNVEGVTTYQLDKPDFHEAITGKGFLFVVV